MRALYGKEPTAAARGLTASHFSFNVEGGAATRNRGEGFETVEMQFLADVRLLCPVCQGLRFKPEVLSVERNGVSIADVLEMTVERALTTFQAEAPIQRALGPLALLGLGYLRLGQPLTTLSGGEAQRLKLARTLSEELRGALLILDEPSAGLHADEVKQVLQALSAIVTAGGSVLVVVHDLDVIGNADYVIDLGPGAGTRGGQLLAVGPPRELSNPDSKTAAALRDYFAQKPQKRRAAKRPETPPIDARSRAALQLERGARARAQPERRVGRDPARQVECRDRAERLGQELARIRRGVRRRSAALSRDAHAVRASIFADHATPRRRSRQRRAAVHRARAKNDARRRQVDGRHRD